ncbi:hypothetical protein [Nocardiopsis lucentensis]|uniref:hypothetical protein n=1 Tax=Nocardiopsis lucentensis TaxID=53441 RepID=UPI00034DBD2C|nr:hypothetical protein [Nocardiopsis lucentensis]
MSETLDTDLPVHPVTGLRALAVIGERPVWPVLGGALDDEEDEGTTEEGDGGTDETAAPEQEIGEDDEADPEGAEHLGDPGKKALAAQKEKWKAERDRRRELEKKLAESSRGERFADEDAVRAATEAVTAKANARILRSEVRAAAAGKLADPKDALRLLDLGSFDVDDDGEVDSEEISDAIDDLIKRKPYLAAQGGTRPRFEGTADSGARKGTGKPKQLTRADLKRMSPEQIVKARADGRLDDALGISTR